MGPKPLVPQSGALFQQTLLEMFNPKHPLVRLADVIDWKEFERTFGAHFVSTTGQTALRPRLIAGLLCNDPRKVAQVKRLIGSY